MKKLLISLVAALALLTSPAGTADFQFVYKNAVLGTTSTLVSFGFQAEEIMVQNRNPAAGITVYVDWLGQTADASDDEVPANTSVLVRVRGSSLSIVSASATSSVLVRVIK